MSDDDDLGGLSRMSSEYVYDDDDEDDDPLDYSDDDFMDDDDDDDEMGLLGDGHEKPAEDEVEFLTPSELLRANLDAIKTISEIFKIPPGTARLLLEHHKFNKDLLIEKFAVATDEEKEKMFDDAHCINPNNESVVEEIAMCSICGEDAPEEIEQLPCGHPFCRECWQDHLVAKIDTIGTEHISCPEYDCDILADEFTITKILSDDKFKKTVDRYYTRVANDVVTRSKTLKWCPNKDCSLIAKVGSSSVLHVTCRCGFSFCFQCGLEDHSPTICAMIEQWNQKSQDDSETANWLKANTKPCPDCKEPIEKNQGCNHMTCSRCKHEFCWICLGEWSKHGSSWYKCTRFNEEDAVEARKEVEDSRASLNRYLFFFNRYADHMKSRQFEEQLTAVVKKKMAEMQKTGMSWMDVQFMTLAVASLRRARIILQYTYAFAFYLEKTSHCEIFLDNQENLQISTEKLSEYLEKDLGAAHDFAKLKMEVVNLSKYCEGRSTTLVQHVYEGYRKGYWKYREPEMERIMSENTERFVDMLSLVA